LRFVHAVLAVGLVARDDLAAQIALTQPHILGHRERTHGLNEVEQVAHPDPQPLPEPSALFSTVSREAELLN
jgi:hypothetical protein